MVTAALLSGFLLIDGNPGTALEVWPLRGSGEAWALLKNLGHRLPEVFTVVRCQWREKAAEFGVHLGMESRRRPAAGIGRRHPQRTPVAWHRRLLRAMDGADAVVSTAAGYTRHSKGDTPEVDKTGNRNFADAASRAGIRRFVLTSILTCDQTPQVPHFWHKKLAEDKLEEVGVPFVSLRPGAFLDQITQMGGDAFAKRRLMWVGSPTIPLTYVLTSDVADYLADAVDAPGVDGQRIDIGWDRPVSMQEIAQISGRLLGQEIRVRTIPAGLINAAAAVVGRFSPMVKDMDAMLRWFQTGGYVADPTRQREVFGQVPTAEEAISRFVGSLGHAVAA